MYNTPAWSIILHLVVCLALTGDAFADNYPSKPDTLKSCARRKNTITYTAALCEYDSKTKSYSKDSETACKEDMKYECKEFNEAACEEYQGRHCCKLWYKAKDTVWMEIYYANQYNASSFSKPEDRVYDVIEIHRNISNEYAKYFANASQPDYPDNVLDPNGERGLKWTDVTDLKKPNFNTTALCHEKEGEVDDRCARYVGDNLPTSGTVFNYIKDNYADGFESDKHKIPKTQYENDIGAKIRINYDSICIHAFINKTKVPVCNIAYRRNGIPADNKSAITSFVYLEAQLMVDAKGVLKGRYGYWNIEDPVTRDIIFKDKEWDEGMGNDGPLV